MHTNVFTCVKVLPRKESLGLGGGGGWLRGKAPAT